MWNYTQELLIFLLLLYSNLSDIKNFEVNEKCSDRIGRYLPNSFITLLLRYGFNSLLSVMSYVQVFVAPYMSLIHCMSIILSVGKVMKRCHALDNTNIHTYTFFLLMECFCCVYSQCGYVVMATLYLLCL